MTKPSPWGGEPAELAPCPFCGYGDVQFTSERYDLVLCPACGTEGPATFDRGEAIAAWNRRTPSQSRENAGPPHQIADALYRLAQRLDIAGPGDAEMCRLAAHLIRDQVEMLAEFDAAPVTDARIWDGVRDAIEKRLRDEQIGEPYREFADELARIALGEREP